MAENIQSAPEAPTKKMGALVKWIPVLLMIGSNLAYTVTAKVTPEDVDTYASVSLTYVVCIAYAMIMFFITSKNKNYIQ